MNGVEVPHASIDARDLCGDGRDCRQKCGPRHIASEQHGVFVRSEVSLDAYRTDGQGQGLESETTGHFGYGRLHRVEVGAVWNAVAAQDAHAESRSRERVPPQRLPGDAEALAQLPNLHLVELGQRLHDLPGGDHLFDDGHAVVVGLYGVCAAGSARLDGVGVDGTLPEEMM